VSYVTAKQIIAPTTATPGANFAGIAFNATGQLYMATPNQLYRLENNLTLTNLGVFSSSGAGADITSCNFPLVVLPVTFQRFSATAQRDNSVLLTWSLSQEMEVKDFIVERSVDGTNWQDIGTSEDSSFTDSDPLYGANYYRIRWVEENGASGYSVIRKVGVAEGSHLVLWPNPARDMLCVRGDGGTIRIFDLRGQVLIESLLQAGMSRISLASLASGDYIAQVELSNGQKENRLLIRE
jgi:hypothetical protein